MESSEVLKKFHTKHSFGSKKRKPKPRGRSGGRKSASNASIVDENTSSCVPVDDNGKSANLTGEVQLPSQRKISAFSLFESNYDDGKTSKNTSECTSDVASTNTGYHYPASGYRLVAIDCIENIINSLACAKCGKSTLDFKEKVHGLKSVFSITCENCSENIKVSSARDEKRGHNETNLLAVAAGRNSGMGYQALCNFMGNMDIPKPMHLKTYQNTAKHVHDASVAAVEENMQHVAQIIHQTSANETGRPTSEEIINIAISFDGTWHKRGHTSLFGVGVAIDLLTGFVIDFACMSKYCHGCELGPKPNDTNYSKWKKSHAKSCQINFVGSSSAMEVQAASVIFERSISKYNLRYTTMLSDGDSNAFLKVKSKNVYGDDFPIEKEDCINHVAKRMGTALRKLKQEQQLGGKGKLTDEIIIKLQNYYGKALKDNAPDTEKMKQAVYASLFHVVSTDEEPHHRFCPPGKMSWCHYQRSLIDETQKRPHKPELSKDIAEKLLPTYSRLTDENLLQRCGRNKTQNANESFNSLIWRRCPKTEFTSLHTLETAVGMAVLEHNKGAHGYHSIVAKLDIGVGENQKCHAAVRNKRRLDDCERSVLQKRKKQRKIKKIQQAKASDRLKKQEGVTYQAGGF